MTLRVDNIHVFYGPAQALDGVSLHVHSHEIVTVIGANGAGKSTLLKTITGLQPPRVGKIFLDEEDITSKPPYRIARKGVIMVPEGRQIFLPLTVRENLEMGMFARNDLRRKMSTERMFDETFGLFPILRERQRQKASTLSGGEQQMLAIGRALMSNPRVLLLDEPSMGLAPLLVAVIFETIKRLHESGIEMVLVEQNAYEALQLANRGYVLENGRLGMEDTAENLMHNSKVQALYLGGTLTS